MTMTTNIDDQVSLLLINHSGTHIYRSKNPDRIIKIYMDNEIYLPQCEIALHLSQLIPQYVPKVYDIKYIDGHISIIMDYIDGITQREFVSINNKDTKIIYKIVHSLIEAVTSLHNAGYVHNDLNNKNIIITKDYNVKLIDFDDTDDISAVDPGDGITPMIEYDKFHLKFLIAQWIFPDLPERSIVDTEKITNKYSEKNVVGYDTYPIDAYNLYIFFKQIKYDPIILSDQQRQHHY